jgi:hypothetical protein
VARNAVGCHYSAKPVTSGSVGHYVSDGVLELSVFKVRGAIPERVQATRATRLGSATKGQVRGPDEFSAPATLRGRVAVEGLTELRYVR